MRVERNHAVDRRGKFVNIEGLHVVSVVVDNAHHAAVIVHLLIETSGYRVSKFELINAVSFLCNDARNTIDKAADSVRCEIELVVAVKNRNQEITPLNRPPPGRYFDARDTRAERDPILAGNEHGEIVICQRDILISVFRAFEGVHHFAINIRVNVRLRNRDSVAVDAEIPRSIYAEERLRIKPRRIYNRSGPPLRS